MGRRGPQPKPTALKRLAGNPGKRRLNEREPQPPPGAPDVPAWLSAGAKRHWRAIVPVLADMGVLTKADGTALALLCDALVDYLAAGKVIDAAAHGRAARFTAVTPQGCVIQHPAVGVRNRAWERVLRVLRDFGLTPSSRSGIVVAPKGAKDDWLGNLLEGRN